MVVRAVGVDHVQAGVGASARGIVREVGELPVGRPGRVPGIAACGRDTTRAAAGEVEYVDGAAPEVPLGVGRPRGPERPNECDPAAIR